MRFALFYAPSPSSQLWQLGCRWLGRDAFSQTKVEQNYSSLINTSRITELTGTPRRYGFHATLKPPFRLAENSSENKLISAINDFTKKCRPCVIPPLILGQIDNFFCLCPAEPSLKVNALADTCVKEFDSFRAPPSSAELVQRRALTTTQSQRQNLISWGYPHVMHNFRLHITLTDRIVDDTEKQILRPLLTDLFSPILGKPLTVDAIALFTEPGPGEPFIYSMRFPFSGH